MSSAGAPWAARPGIWYPLGATVRDGGTNFAVASEMADGMLLCLFDSHGAETRIPMPDRDGGVWHAFLPGVGAGQAYGYRATGPYDPGRGARCNPAKLLLDPYALATTGEVRFGPEVLGHAPDDPATCSTTAAAVYQRAISPTDGPSRALAPARGRAEPGGGRRSRCGDRGVGATNTVNTHAGPPPSSARSTSPSSRYVVIVRRPTKRSTRSCSAKSAELTRPR